MEDMIILTQTYDLLLWLLPHCDKFPASHKFVLTRRLQDAAFDFHEALHEANARSGQARLQYLQAADADLNKLRLYLRIIREWHWLSVSQYEHASRRVAEIGKLLGGWIRQTKGRAQRES